MQAIPKTFRRYYCMCEEIAKTAAAWWVKQIEKRCIFLCPDRIIKDKSNFIVVDVSLQEVLSRFEEALYIEIKNQLEKFHYMYLGCSYSPDEPLSRLAKEINIPFNFFPIHADMEIYDSSIRVSYGNIEWHEIRSSA